MKIAVRLDDITPDMDWPKFFRFKDILDKYNIKPLIGVIPCNLDDTITGSTEGAPSDFASYIGELRESGWTVAMHGYNHKYSTKKGGLFPLNSFSEFAGVDYEKQLSMLKEGKRVLNEKGIETDIFMPPGHTYDKNTLKALKESGFTTLVDAFAKGPVSYRDMKFIPISFKLGRTLKKYKAPGYSTMVIHTGAIKDTELDGYEKIFADNRITFVPYSELLLAPVKKRGALGHIKEYNMAKIKNIMGSLLFR